MAEYLLGFDIGGTKCAVALGKTEAEEITVLERVSFATETARGPEYALARLEESAQQVVASHGLTLADIRAAGISCGGPLDSGRGVIQSPPNLPGWDDIPITARFAQSLGVPVALQNDANACALAEWRWGAGRGSRHMIFLTFGTGLGAGLILDGHLYCGASDLAGEVGHVRLAEDGPIGYHKAGSFEGFCSGNGIAQAGQTLVLRARADGTPVAFYPEDRPIEGLTTQIIAEAACSGDPLAQEIFATCAHYLGRGLAMLIDILNPELIVIGSIFARQHALLWPTAARVIEQEALPPSARRCRVVPAMLGEAIGDYACLSVALNI
ncbi:MAG TPA: ROK family protein [Armatimonadota bacterium]|jgi:glucokinase